MYLILLARPWLKTETLYGRCVSGAVLFPTLTQGLKIEIPLSWVWSMHSIGVSMRSIDDLENPPFR